MPYVLKGVLANVHYTLFTGIKFYQGLASDEKWPVRCQFFSGAKVPIYPSLTQQEREWVVEAVQKIFKISVILVR